MTSRLLTLCALALAALTVVTSLAAAAEVTRESYREAVEPICRADTQANERIFAGVRQEVRQGKLKTAATKFRRAAGALKSAIAQIQKVPAPAADAARLSKWLGKVSNEAGYFEAVARKLSAGDKAGAERLVNKLTTEAGAANNVVIPFEFQYCRLEPSRFT
ncbi:hypothetical protein [Pseudomonas sp.]|uniref:hypothetical protein n=1 Tax=Pseudomonas sp. TaxID=306 RepID=UPI002610096A|nr:hypothetical protein [Pseudomonas sp.]